MTQSSKGAARCHVVILNWYGTDDTDECLRTLLHHEPTIDITVIDNSEDHSGIHKLADKYCGVEFVFNATNVGFAAGCNQGFLHSLEVGASHTLFLNNDTVIVEPFIDKIVNWMHESDNVGAVSPRINYFYAPEIPWFHASTINELTMEIVHNNDITYNSPVKVPWLTGCALFVSNAAFSRVNGFDSLLFMYSEDVDLSIKLTNAGYNLAVYPLMPVLHKVGSSSNKVSNISMYYAVRNKILIMRRYFPLRVYRGFATLFKTNLVQILKSENNADGKVKMLATLLKACFVGLTIKITTH